MSGGEPLDFHVFPVYDTQLFGYPPTVELTESEAKFMRLVHLGGIEAASGRGFRGRTVDSLVSKGLLDKHGPTPLGRSVARSVVEMEMQ